MSPEPEAAGVFCKNSLLDCVSGILSGSGTGYCSWLLISPLGIFCGFLLSCCFLVDHQGLTLLFLLVLPADSLPLIPFFLLNEGGAGRRWYNKDEEEAK